MIDWAAFESAVNEAVVGAIDESLEEIVGLARQKAPVRKVFAGGRRGFRTKSMAEAEQDRRTLMRLGPQFAAPPRSTLRHPRSRFMQAVVTGNPNNTPFSARERKLTAAGHLKLRSMESRLSRRGRSELASLRAAFGGSLGGRLQAEIYSTGATIDGSRIGGSVISPTPYAKYQEFGTRHNPAHPYLRPALEENRGRTIARIANALSSVGLVGEPIAITVHFVAA